MFTVLQTSIKINSAPSSLKIHPSGKRLFNLSIWDVKGSCDDKDYLFKMFTNHTMYYFVLSANANRN